MNEAIQALKSGDRVRAFDLLRRHLQANPTDADAWLWMSEAAPHTKMKIDALVRVLKLRPEHPRAGIIRRRIVALSETLAAAEESEPLEKTPVSERLPVEERPLDEILAEPQSEALHPAPEVSTIDDSLDEPETETIDEEQLSLLESEEATLTALSSEPSSSAVRIYGAPEAPVTVEEEVDYFHLEEQEIGEQLRDDEEVVPAAVPEPRQQPGRPGWVWDLALLFLVLVAIVSFVAFLMFSGIL
ncbi:MAG: hypothetical protein M3220_16170 [Chloroflexota bacterium]|nr:hypothetical protein [Chloroflexota bacterium]